MTTTTADSGCPSLLALVMRDEPGVKFHTAAGASCTAHLLLWAAWFGLAMLFTHPHCVIRPTPDVTFDLTYSSPNRTAPVVTPPSASGTKPRLVKHSAPSMRSPEFRLTVAPASRSRPQKTIAPVPIKPASQCRPSLNWLAAPPLQTDLPARGIISFAEPATADGATSPTRIPAASRISCGVNTPIAPLSTDAAADPTKYGENFLPYMRDMMKRIKRHWYPPKCSSAKVRLSFRIARDGTLLDCHMVNCQPPDASPLHISAALDAVRNSAPFPPLWEGAPESIQVEYPLEMNWEDTKQEAPILTY